MLIFVAHSQYNILPIGLSKKGKRDIPHRNMMDAFIDGRFTKLSNDDIEKVIFIDVDGRVHAAFFVQFSLGVDYRTSINQVNLCL